MEGANSDFEIIKQIHSHKVDIFGVLSALTFLQEYCKQYFLEIKSDITYYYEHLEAVDEIKLLLVKPKCFQQ